MKAPSSSMPLHEWWRHLYRDRRYCRHLTQRELNERLRDLMLAGLVLTPEAKIGLGRLDERGKKWMQLLTDVFEEMALRNAPYPTGYHPGELQSAPLPEFAGPLGRRAAKALEHLPRTGAVIKFGQAKYMRELYSHGALRVQSACFYRRPDHNGAIRDDEMALELALTLNREHVIKLVNNPQDVPPDLQSQRFDLRFESPTDYWLYCLTTAVEPRIFVDFEADACVVIKDPHRFLTAVDQAIKKHVGDANFKHGKVAYIDPLLPETGNIDVSMAKHFRYVYQQEYRLAWVPQEPRRDLSCIDIAVGSLEEYAELIALPRD